VARAIGHPDLGRPFATDDEDLTSSRLYQLDATRKAISTAMAALGLVTSGIGVAR
jgi:hypothetical protein